MPKLIPPLDLYNVRPVGTSVGFGSGPAGCGLVEAPTFPRSHLGSALREMRVAAGMSLRQAANLLDLRPVHVSGLERGSIALEARDWVRVLEIASSVLDEALEEADDTWCAPMLTCAGPLDPGEYDRDLGIAPDTNNSNSVGHE